MPITKTLLWLAFALKSVYNTTKAGSPRYNAEVFGIDNQINHMFADMANAEA